MYLKFPILTILLIVNMSINQLVLAQKPRENSWYRITIKAPLNKNLKLSTEFQHRRQNDYDNKNYNSQALTSSFRLWLDYRKNDHLTFSFSPFAYFDISPTYNEAHDRLKNNKKEIRFATAITAKKTVFQDFTAFSKLDLEYRTFLKNSDIVRLREKIGLNYHYQSLTLTAYNELFVNVVGTPITHFYDQNRMSGAINVRASHCLGIELGYIRSNKLPIHTIEKQKENIIYLNLTMLLERHKG